MFDNSPMSEDRNNNPQNMGREELLELLQATQEKLKVAKQTIQHQSETIIQLQATARNFYRAASDYVPPAENDYDG